MEGLRRIRQHEISARIPLPFAVFDRHGREIFPAGVVIGSIGYAQLLLGRGLFRRTTDADNAPGGGAAPQT